MSLRDYTRGASGSGALLALCTLLLACRIPQAGTESHIPPPGCQPARIDERVQVSYVFDGDTVRLSDGRRVRFIGINTPETGHHGRRAQPYAEAARKGLQEALESGGNTLALQYGSERRDHYGRHLAHAYLSNGDSVAALLLRQGLATTLVVPPNTAATACYQRIEDAARAARRGLWQLADYQAQDADSLPGDTSGFHIVLGRVTGMQRSRYQVRITLEGLLVARIANKDLANFNPGYLEKLVNHTVELRGWIKPEKGGLGVRIRHPAALAPAGDPPGT